MTSLSSLIRWIYSGFACLILTAGMMTTTASVGWGQSDEAREEMSKVIATIDGDDITLNLVMALISQLPQQYQGQPFERLYDPILDDIIDTRLAAAEAKRSGIADDPLIEELAQRAYDRVMAEAWLSIEIQNRITDEMIEARYKEIAADEDSRTEIRARHILVNTETEAEDIIRRLKEGESFEELAKTLSIGPSGPNGGDLGYFQRGDMVPSFADASFALEVGAISENPVQTNFGWHIIKAEDRRVIPIPPLAEIGVQIGQAMASELASKIADELYEKANIRRLDLDEVLSNQ